MTSAATSKPGSSLMEKMQSIMAKAPSPVSRLVNPCHAESILGNINTLRLRQNGQHFPDNIFKCIFWNENELRLKFH